MAKIIFSVMGSYGDLHPSLAIGLELRRRGHDITLATTEIYREKIARLGFRFVELKPSLTDLGPEESWAAKAMDPRDSLEFILREVALPWTNHNAHVLLQAGRDAAGFVSNTITFATPLAAEKLNLPWLSLVLQPMAFCSIDDPPVLAPFPWLYKLRQLSRPAYAALFSLGRLRTRFWLAPWREAREALDLPPTESNPLFEGQFSPYGTLALFSPVLAQPQPDWPVATLQTGFCLYDEDGSPELSPALEEFLRAGPPPLVFTLGTAAVMDAGSFYRTAADVVRTTHERAVLLVGRDARNRTGLPHDPRIFVSEYEPYSRLFPRASVNVHQGGIGTTAQALLAGRPQIICPYANDQPDNAERARRLGVAAIVPRHELDVASIKRALASLRASTHIESRCTSIAEQLKHEDGVRRAADAIEARFVQSHVVSAP